MDNQIKIVFGLCKCEHIWMIRKRVPKYCPKCHRRVDEATQIYKIVNEDDVTHTANSEPIYTLKSGDSIEVYWNIPKQEREAKK